MKSNFWGLLVRPLKEESGQILPWMALVGVAVVGMAGLTVDLGRAWSDYRQLQASSDAAALAGAYALNQPGATTTSVESTICTYGANSTGGTGCPVGLNASPNLPNAVTNVSFLCVTDSSLVTAPCSASSTNYNVVQVTQTASVPTMFIRVMGAIGLKTLAEINLSTTSTATMMSGMSKELNVAIVLDTTASMGDEDSVCGMTKIKCALSGVRTLLGMMQPCSLGSTASNCKSAYDQATLFTFPPMEVGTTSNDTTCPSSNPTTVSYFAPTPGAAWSNLPPTVTGSNGKSSTNTAGTYQITTEPTSGTQDDNNGFFDNYSLTNAAGGGLDTTSGLAIASGGGSCQGVQTPGGDGTYIASAIYSAQQALMAAQAANPGSSNYMIVETDGEAAPTSGKTNFPSCTGTNPAAPCTTGTDSTGMKVTYPSTSDACHQSILAANFATSQGTTVYTISYGSNTTGCTTDTGSYAISPCTELQQMSSGYSSGNTSHFFADSTSACGGSDTLADIFPKIGAQLTAARLIPNGTT
jgi:hypothetical protein